MSHMMTTNSKRIIRLASIFLCLSACTLAQTPVEPVDFARWTAERQALMADPSVVAYYDFQEGKGTVLRNRSKAGSVLDGAIRGARWDNGRWPGKKALRFDGSTSVVEIPSVDTLCALDKAKGGTGEMTVEVWLTAATSQEAGIVDKSSAGWGKDAPYMIWVSPNRLCAHLGKQPGHRVTSVRDREEMTAGDWMHVAMVITPKSLALYKDGALVGRTRRAASVSDNGKPLLLGSMGALRPGKFYFCGLLDEVVIYNRALPAAAIMERAELAPAPAGPPSIKLTSPRAGERWCAGSQHRMTWDSANLRTATALSIEFSSDDGKNWQEVSAATRNTKQFLWRVPATLSDACRIRVSVNGVDLVTQSDGPFAIVPSQEVRNYEWVKVALPAAFAPRDGAGALVYSGRMWLIGGWNPSDKKHFPRICNNEVWSSRDGADWTLVKPNSFLDRRFDSELDWEGRHTAGYAVYNGKMWIVGGDANQGHYMFDVWSSTDGTNWTYVNKGKPVPWGPRVLHYTLVFKDRIWVMGGQTIPQIGKMREAFYRDVWTTTDGINWTQVIPKEPFWPQRGMIGGNVVFNDRMWILGGGTYNTPKVPVRKFFNDVWSSSDGVNWQCHVSSAPWAPRQYHEVAVFDGRMWVLEGSNRGNRNDVWYSSDGVNWYELTGTPWKPRHAASVFVHDNALWMVAGNNMESDVWKLVKAAASGK